MSRFNTGNHLGSGSPLDLDDNAKNLDVLTNSREALSNPDRFGVQRKSWYGMERDHGAAQSSREVVFLDFLQASGYQDLGEYAPSIEITAHNQYVTFGGQPYLLKPSIPVPYTTSGEWTGDDFKLIGDDTLRQDLANPDKGAAMVARAAICFSSVEEIESSSLPAGTVVYLTQEGRAGEFVVKSGTPPSDPQKGIYIVLANGNYAERIFSGHLYVQWFGASPDLADSSSQIQAAIDLDLTYQAGVGSAYPLQVFKTLSEIRVYKNTNLDFKDSTIQAVAGFSGDQIVKVIGIEAINYRQSNFLNNLKVVNSTGADLRGMYVGADDPLNIPTNIGTVANYVVRNRSFDNVQFKDCYLEVGEAASCNFNRIHVEDQYRNTGSFLFNGQNINIRVSNSDIFSGLSFTGKVYNYLGTKRSEGIDISNCFITGDVGVVIDSLTSSSINNSVIDLNRVAISISNGNYIKISGCFMAAREEIINLDPIGTYSALTNVSFVGCELAYTSEATRPEASILVQQNRYMTSFTSCSIPSGTGSIFKFSEFGGNPTTNKNHLLVTDCSFAGESGAAAFDTIATSVVKDKGCVYRTIGITNDFERYENSAGLSITSSITTSDIPVGEYGNYSCIDYVQGYDATDLIKVIRMQGGANVGEELGIGYAVGGVAKRSISSGVLGKWNELATGSSGFREARPTDVPVGYMYFDRTFNIPTWWNGTNWVDATGTEA